MVCVLTHFVRHFKRMKSSARLRRIFLVVNFVLVILIAQRLLLRLLYAVDNLLEEATDNHVVGNVDSVKKGNPVYRLLLNEPNFCRDEEVQLLVLVASAVSHTRERLAIRDTWAKGYDEVRVLFMLGHDDQIGDETVAAESNEHGDLIQEDFKDTYHNLTLKTLMGLRWATEHCSKAKYVMKTDDDIYVNMEYLLGFLDTSKPEKIVGCIKNLPNNAFSPIGSAAMANVNLPLAHPLFAAGAGYVLPGFAVSKLLSAAMETKLFPVEDVFITGHVARRVDLHPPLHDNRFSCGQMLNDACEARQVFTGHKVGPDKMIRMHYGRHNCD